MTINGRQATSDREVRSHVFAMTGGKCARCGLTLDPYAAPGAVNGLHIDHVIPKSLHGLDHVSNYQPLCASCNLAKGNRTTTDYRTQELRDRYPPPSIPEAVIVNCATTADTGFAEPNGASPHTQHHPWMFMRSPDRTAKEEVAALRRVVKESTGSISRHLAWGAVELLGPREAIACCLRVGWDSKSLLVITGQRIIHVETEKRVWWNLDNIHRVEIKKRRGSGTPRKLAFVSDGERWSWTMPEKGVAARGVTVPELERALRGGPSSGRTPSG